jgi:hypothetical protein
MCRSYLAPVGRIRMRAPRPARKTVVVFVVAIAYCTLQRQPEE